MSSQFITDLKISVCLQKGLGFRIRGIPVTTDNPTTSDTNYVFLKKWNLCCVTWMPYRSLTDALMAREAGGTQPIQSSRGRQGHAPTALVTLQVNTGRQHRAKQPTHTQTHKHTQEINSQYRKTWQFVVTIHHLQHSNISGKAFFCIQQISVL